MIYIFIAPGFEEMEAVAPLDILRRAELDVRTVGIGGKIITGAHGIPLVCDLLDADARLEDLEMVVLPGGMPGALNLESSAIVQAFLDHAVKNNLWIGAICAAPSILGHRGDLDGKQATCFPGFETQLGGGTHTGEPVVQDGKIITARGAGVAVEFGLKLVECLKDETGARILGASLQI